MAPHINWRDICLNNKQGRSKFEKIFSWCIQPQQNIILTKTLQILGSLFANINLQLHVPRILISRTLKPLRTYQTAQTVNSYTISSQPKGKNKEIILEGIYAKIQVYSGLIANLYTLYGLTKKTLENPNYAIPAHYVAIFWLSGASSFPSFPPSLHRSIQESTPFEKEC